MPSLLPLPSSPWLRLRSGGRGSQYTKLRATMESCLRALYQHSWPARLWARVPGATRVRLVEHELPCLPRGRSRPALRVAFVSDLHLGPTTPQATVNHAFACLSQLQADVLVLGGDYVFLDATENKAAQLERLVKQLGMPTKVAVLGNHDLWTEHGRLEAALARAGVQVLVNEARRLPAPFDDVSILGLDDPWTGSIDAARALASAGDAALKLAVCHSPDGFLSIEDRGVSLLVCGHTHGGQIALPGSRPLVLPPGRCCKKWPHGLHRAGSTWIFVSRGIGATEVPVRTWAPPEVALFVLREAVAPPLAAE